MERTVLLRIILISVLITVSYLIASTAVFATENAMFPMQYLNISQGVNGTYSHQGRLAIDICGADTGQDAFYAPFTGTIKKTYGSDNVIWLESNEPVQFADGTVDYMTIMCMHDNDISDLYVGKVIQQGEHFLTEGAAGSATGNHIHLECGKGKFTGSGWYQNSYGKWCINNGVNPWDALFLSGSTIVYNDYGYNWRYVSATPPTNPQIRIYVDKVLSGKPILFEYSVNDADEMYIAIDVNGVREHFIEVSGDHYNGTFTKPGHYEAYLYAVNTGGNSGLSNCVSFDVYESPPTNPNLKIYTNKVAARSPILFEYSVNDADAMYIAIDVNGIREHFIEVSGDHYNGTFTKPGHYEAYLYAVNAYGNSGLSNCASFEVYDSSPDHCWITVDKNNISVGDCVNFSFGANNANEFQLGVFHNGNRVWLASERNEFTSRKVTFTEAGIYNVYVSSYNEFGYCDSEKVVINVYNNSSSPEPIATPTPKPTTAPTPVPAACFTVTQSSGYTDVQNTSAAAQSAAVIVAKYDGEILKNVSSVDVTFAAGEKRTFMYASDGTYKVFVWNSLKGMVPLNVE